jgi:hypothetical protein
MKMSSDGLGVQFYFSAFHLLFLYFDVLFIPFEHYVGVLLFKFIAPVCNAFLCLLLMNQFVCGNLSVS